jgi:sugar O-acyltransferase (sialic acid O-acetyltransferase NeuD family)
MNDILLLGGGGHCNACIDVLEAEGKFNICGLVLPQFDEEQSLLGYPILGDDSNLPILLERIRNALIAVGQIKSAQIRFKLYDLLKSLGANLPIIKAPTAYVSKHATVGEGTILMHGALVNVGAILGVNNIINSQALIEHNAQIGSHCHISTAAKINGEVIIENECFIGSGAIIHQGVRIGAGSIISAGVVVSSDVQPKTILRLQK